MTEKKNQKKYTHKIKFYKKLGEQGYDFWGL